MIFITKATKSFGTLGSHTSLALVDDRINYGCYMTQRQHLRVFMCISPLLSAGLTLIWTARLVRIGTTGARLGLRPMPRVHPELDAEHSLLF